MFVSKEEEIVANKEEVQSINGTIHRVRVINANTFCIGDTTKYTQYERNGIIKYKKVPVEVEFEKLYEVLWSKNPPMDYNMVDADYMKIGNGIMSHIAFETLDKFIVEKKRYPKSWEYDDVMKFVDLGLEMKQEEMNKERLIKFFTTFANTCSYVFPPLAAFMGGYIA